MPTGGNTTDGITRRLYLASLGLGGATALAGCSGTSGEEQADDGGTAGGETEMDQQSGGHLRFGLYAPPLGINPITGSIIEGYVVQKWMYSTLTWRDSNLNVHSDLATDWEASDDSTQWTFMLRDDARFSYNGNRVLAEDVKATFDTVYDEDVGSPGNGALGPIESVEVVNDHAVQINLESSYGNMPIKMAKPWAMIAPKEILDSDGPQALDDTDYGSGPFNLESYVPEDEVVVTANEDYYLTDENGDALPGVQRVTGQVIEDPTTRINNMRNGSSDITTGIPPENWTQLENMSGVRTNTIPGGTFYSIAMRVTDEPFTDNRVRQAFKYAVDKEEILATAQQGLGVLGQDHQLAPFYNVTPDLPQKYGPGAQPERARELLAEAGYDDGLTLDFPLIVSPTSPQMEKTAVLAKEHLSEVGVEFDIRRVSWDQMWSGIFGNNPFSIMSWFCRPEPDFLMNQHNTPGAPWAGETMFHPDEFVETLRAAQSALDPETKKARYRECAEIMQDRGGYIVPFFASRLHAEQSHTENFQPDPLALRERVESVRLNNDT